MEKRIRTSCVESMAVGRSIMKADFNWTRNDFQNMSYLGIPWQPSTDSEVWLPRLQFQSLVVGISCKPEAETNKQTQKTKPPSSHLLASLPVFNVSFLFQLLEPSCSCPSLFIISPVLLKKPMTFFCLVDQLWTLQASIWSPSTSPKGFVFGPFEQTQKVFGYIPALITASR